VNPQGIGREPKAERQQSPFDVSFDALVAIVFHCQGPIPLAHSGKRSLQTIQPRSLVELPGDIIPAAARVNQGFRSVRTILHITDPLLFGAALFAHIPGNADGEFGNGTDLFEVRSHGDSVENLAGKLLGILAGIPFEEPDQLSAQAIVRRPCFDAI
jgi:hypothetical protein